MKTLTTLAFTAVSALALTAGAANAQSWQPINQRQATLEARIDAGVRSGALTRAEAQRLRSDFDAVAHLENRYRSNGLSDWERQDLDRRFDQLATQIRIDRNDRDGRGDQNGWYGGRGWTDNRGTWMNINQRQRELDRRIDVGLRNGRLTQAEAVRLRGEFRSIAQLEARYRQGGLSVNERNDLDRRFDQLSMRIRFEANDQNRYGQGYGYNR